MTGVPLSSYGRGIDDVSLIFTAFVLVVCGFFFLFGFAFGFYHGGEKYWSQEKTNCTKHEMRQFADTGFLFYAGSGEITTRNVCVEWVMKR
jgi:hypothetical protein